MLVPSLMLCFDIIKCLLQVNKTALILLHYCIQHNEDKTKRLKSVPSTREFSLKVVQFLLEQVVKYDLFNCNFNVM